jgi:superfamily II DNA/RNA helicase
MQIGRTGRFGREGVAINVIETEAEYRMMKQLERHFSPNRDLITKQPLADIGELGKCLH